MKIFFPQNIFTELINSSVNENVASLINFLPSSLITSEVLKNSDSIGLIPTMDLIRHKDLFVSKSFGISFEESLCNSYFYFCTHGNDIKELSLVGDVSSNEAIGGKLILKELYGVDVQVNLLTENRNSDEINILSVGDINFNDDKFMTGISFAEEMIEVLSLPYVNFVLVSTGQGTLEDFHSSIKDIQLKIYNQAESESFGNQLSAKSKEKIKENISSFICKLDEQDRDGIDQLLRLAFYHKITSEIIEVKFV
jgi:hypothetical protein